MYFYNNSAFWFQNIPLLKRIPFIENFLFFEIRASLSWLWSLLRFIYFHSNAQYKLCYLYNINCSNIFSDNWVTINLTQSLVHFEVEVSFGFSKSKFTTFLAKCICRTETVPICSKTLQIAFFIPKWLINILSSHNFYEVLRKWIISSSHSTALLVPTASRQGFQLDFWG